MINLLLSFSVFVSRSTSQDELKKFLLKVRPIKTEHMLKRIGGSVDGGYLVPDDFDGVSACFSPGVSEIATFESELAAQGIKSFMADFSVNAPPVKHDFFDFEKKFLGDVNNLIFMTLESWIHQKCVDSADMILQMDIEGAEYRVLLSTPSQVLRRFRILVIEFHDLNSLFSRGGFELIDTVFNKILEDFYVVHIHPNNCVPIVGYGEIQVPPVMEFTFIRKDRVVSKSFEISLPHPLDSPNMPQYKDIYLPSCWYS